MEVYATLVESADHEVGRLVDAIEELGELDNTLFFYIAGDNGGSSIGDINGVFVEWSALNGAPEDIPYLLSRLDEYGGPSVLPELLRRLGRRRIDARDLVHPDGARAAATWPARSCTGPRASQAKGEIRRQYASVIDVVPTILEAVGVPEPKVVNGHEQTPMAGVSMAYTLRRRRTPPSDTPPSTTRSPATAASTTTAGSPRSSTARPGSRHRASSSFDDDRWELYHMAEDFGLANDLADAAPRQARGDEGALRPGGDQEQRVYPLDDRSFERLNPVVAGRPDLMFGRTELTLYPGMTGMTENSFINTKAVSYRIERRRSTIPDGGAEGVILSQAGQTGGWSLYVKDGKPKYAYNWLARETYTIESDRTPPRPAHVAVDFEFDYDGGGLHKGATGRLTSTATPVAEGRIERTMGAVYSLAGETADVGIDAFSPVTDDYDPWNNAFTGTIDRLVVKLTEPPSIG